MTKNIDFDRLRYLEQAGQQLEELKSLKCKLAYQEMSEVRQKQQQFLVERSSNLILLYQHIISLYTSQIIGENDNTSNRRSHSRSKISQKFQKNANNDIKIIIIHAELSCTIAYIQNNMLSNFQEGSLILLRIRGDLTQLIHKLSDNKEYTSQHYDKNHYYHNLIYQSYIRVSINLVMSLILQNRHPFAIEVFDEVIKFITSVEVEELRLKLVECIYQWWFNVKGDGWKVCRERIKKENGVMMGYQGQGRELSVERALALALFIFNSDLFLLSSQQNSTLTYPTHSIQILQKCHTIFTSHNLHNLSFFTLRHLLQSPLSPQLKQHYYIQLSNMFQNELISSNVLVQNVDSVQTFKFIIGSLHSLEESMNIHNVGHQRSAEVDKEKKELFKLIVKLQISRISYNNHIGKNEKALLLQKLQTMKNETNTQIIASMLDQPFAQHLLYQITDKINSIFSFIHHRVQSNGKCFIQNCQSYQKYQKQQYSVLIQKSINNFDRKQNKSQLKLRSVSPNHSRKYLKVISTSILTENSVLYDQNYTKKTISETNVINFANTQKKVSKMVRFCEHGAFLNKRNFNTDGGQSKFIKITHDKIKWSKNPQKIDQSSHSYPLKDIKGIIYGKVAPNWKKSCNNALKEELCFSLILQKRTMDFCCKNYHQVENWVCGISNILKKINPQIVGYTPGKMRWRKMFANLRQYFIQPLKLHERNNFYFQNAYSLILFKKNQYKLTSNQRIL